MKTKDSQQSVKVKLTPETTHKEIFQILNKHDIGLFSHIELTSESHPALCRTESSSCESTLQSSSSLTSCVKWTSWYWWSDREVASIIVTLPEPSSLTTPHSVMRDDVSAAASGMSHWTVAKESGGLVQVIGRTGHMICSHSSGTSGVSRSPMVSWWYTEVHDSGSGCWSTESVMSSEEKCSFSPSITMCLSQFRWWSVCCFWWKCTATKFPPP